MHPAELFFLATREHRLLALETALDLEIAMPSRVRILMRSALNSAKAATMLKNIFLIGSVGSWIVAPLDGVAFSPLGEYRWPEVTS